MLRMFKKTSIDFVGQRKIAFAISGVLILIGLLSILFHKGLSYGIDFTGGTLIQVHFDKAVDVKEIRDVVGKISKDPMIQHYGTDKDFLIRVQDFTPEFNDTVPPVITKVDVYPDPTAGSKEVALKVEAADNYSFINGIYYTVDGDTAKVLIPAVDRYDSKIEEGNISIPIVGKDKMVLSVWTEDRKGNVSDKIKVNIFITPAGVTALPGDIVEGKLGTIPENDNMQDLENSVSKQIIGVLQEHFKDNKVRVDREEMVGPFISKKLRSEAFIVVILGLAVILGYVSIRFTFRFAIGAVVALIHDVLITLGIFSIFNKDITIPIIAAFLTIIGYSINDSIVVSDRIRENIKLLRKKMGFPEIVNVSINDTLSRTVITSLTTLIVLFALYLFGGSVIHDFAFAMIIGVFVGTYSSIYIMSPIVVEWEMKSPSIGRR